MFKLGLIKHGKDLGVDIDNKLNCDKHHEMEVSKANKMLSMTYRSSMYHNEGMILALYKTLVRPMLGFGHVISFQRYSKDLWCNSLGETVAVMLILDMLLCYLVAVVVVALWLDGGLMW